MSLRKIHSIFFHFLHIYENITKITYNQYMFEFLLYSHFSCTVYIYFCSVQSLNKPLYNIYLNLYSILFICKQSNGKKKEQFIVWYTNISLPEIFRYQIIWPCMNFTFISFFLKLIKKLCQAESVFLQGKDHFRMR